MKALVSIPLVAGILWGCGGSDNNRKAGIVSFPDSVSVRRTSPDSSLDAMLYYWRDDNANMLAAERWYLGFSKGGTKWYFDHELGEGKGNYEGGVFDIEWLSNHQVRIYRRIDDRDANLVFDLRENTLTLDTAVERTPNPQPFFPEHPFEIVIAAQNSPYPSSARDSSSCVTWRLSEQQCLAAMSSMEPISGEDWHHLFAHLACQVTGKIEQANAEFFFSVNAGSWASVTDSFTTQYFGDLKGYQKALFISSAWDPEKEK